MAIHMALNSRVDGMSLLPVLPPLPPPMPPPISRDLTPTSLILLRLEKLLPYHKYQYSIYFDSFFSNTALFATFRELGIGACSTARQAQLPIELQAYDDKSNNLEWGDLASVPRDNVLCERWQDNAGVFLVTTIHDLSDGVTNRKRPKKGIPAVRQVFGTDVRKLLTIPLMINDFGNHIGRGDEGPGGH